MSRKKVAELPLDSACSTCGEKRLVVRKFHDPGTKTNSVEIVCEGCGIVIVEDGRSEPLSPYII